MPAVASGHAKHLGRVVGTGHCVPYVREVTGLPSVAHWRRGALVRGGNCAPGTAISTFNAAGRYPNTTSGDSHCAILLAEEEGGLRVLDQWVKAEGRFQPVHERVIRFKGGQGLAVDDGDRYHVIEVEVA
jgi:hypothetical protein